jgi:hypothetical protein
VIISTQTVLIRLVHCQYEFVICWLPTFTSVCDIRDISLVKEILINRQILWCILMVYNSTYLKKKNKERESLG